MTGELPREEHTAKPFCEGEMMNVMLPNLDSIPGTWSSTQYHLWQGLFSAASNPMLPTLQHAFEQRLDANRELVHSLIKTQLESLHTYLDNFRGESEQQSSALSEWANQLEHMAGQWAELRLAVYDTWFHSARTLPGLMNTPSWPGAGQSLLEVSPALRAWQATLDHSRQWQSLGSAWMLPIASPTQAGMKIKDKSKSSPSKPTEAERAA